MIQASTKAVAHEANINVIGIRSLEIKYFAQFFSNFGTQCALIIGFVLSAISQVPGWDSTAPIFWIAMFWFGAATSIAGAVHVLVCSVLITVFGEGLALRGPLGSMATAVQGMIAEQQQVLFTFNITIFCFACHTVGMYWIMMDYTWAIFSTILTFCSMPVWYYYAQRIYNRFSWSNLAAPLDRWGDEESRDPAAPQLAVAGGGVGAGMNINMLATSGEAGVGAGEQASSAFAALKHGFMTMRVRRQKRLLGGALGDPWRRYFFVVEGSLMHYYKDQRQFYKDASSALNSRPIDLEGYALIAGAMQAPYLITLVPADPEDERKALRFRCDTRAEFERWMGVLRHAAQGANPQEQVQGQQTRQGAGPAGTGTGEGVGAGGEMQFEGDEAALRLSMADVDFEDDDDDFELDGISENAGEGVGGELS